MIVRAIEQKDIPVIAGWLSGHYGAEFNANILPQNGIIIDDLCACFYYVVSNANVIFVEWFCTNPEADKIDSAIGMRSLLAEVSKLKESCIENDVFIMCIVGNKKLAGIIQKFGFGVINRNETTLIGEVV